VKYLIDTRRRNSAFPARGTTGRSGQMVFAQPRWVCGATAAGPGGTAGSPAGSGRLPVGPGLQLVQLGVQAAGPDQRGVIPGRRDPALVQDDDQVGHPDR
jgi:hypothetical protein